MAKKKENGLSAFWKEQPIQRNLPSFISHIATELRLGKIYDGKWQRSEFDVPYGERVPAPLNRRVAHMPGYDLDDYGWGPDGRDRFGCTAEDYRRGNGYCNGHDHEGVNPRGRNHKGKLIQSEVLDKRKVNAARNAEREYSFGGRGRENQQTVQARGETTWMPSYANTSPSGVTAEDLAMFQASGYLPWPDGRHISEFTHDEQGVLRDKQGFDVYGWDKHLLDRYGHIPQDYKRAGVVAGDMTRAPKTLPKEGVRLDEYQVDHFGFNKYGLCYAPDRMCSAVGKSLFDYHEDKATGRWVDDDGYDGWGWDENRRDRWGHTPRDYNQNGGYVDDYDHFGYDEDGYDRDGYDRGGRDREGYDRRGLDIYGCDRDGYDGDGFNADGFNRDGYDREGYDAEGYDENGFDRDGYDRDGYDRNGEDREGWTRQEREWKKAESKVDSEPLYVDASDSDWFDDDDADDSFDLTSLSDNWVDDLGLENDLGIGDDEDVEDWTNLMPSSDESSDGLSEDSVEDSEASNARKPDPRPVSLADFALKWLNPDEWANVVGNLRKSAAQMRDPKSYVNECYVHQYTRVVDGKVQTVHGHTRHFGRAGR